jgi:hypothetical protein
MLNSGIFIGKYQVHSLSVSLAHASYLDSFGEIPIEHEYAIFEALRLSSEISECITNRGGNGETLFLLTQDLSLVAEFLKENNVQW